MSGERGGIRERMRGALTAAIKARDHVAVSALRSTLGAIDNAEAIDPREPTTADGSSMIAVAASGLGATEAVRRALSEADVVAIVAGEIAERRAAADDDEQAGRTEAAEALRSEAAVLSAHLA